MGNLLQQKKFPLNYSTDVAEIITTMSFDVKSVEIVGSSALGSQQYAGDYDLHEVVRGGSAQSYAKGLQKIVSRLLVMPNVFVGEMKAGEIAQWRIIPAEARIEKGRIVGFNIQEALLNLERLRLTKVIDEAEYKEAAQLLYKTHSVEGFLEAEKDLRFHVLRWSPKDVLKGELHLRDGTVVSLVEAISMPAVVKLDVVGFVNDNKYTEFSNIYSFYVNGKPLNDMAEPDIRQSLLYYASTGKWFKVAKRMFSIAKLENMTSVLDRLQPILNGDLGRLYSIVSDMDTLLYLMENEGVLPTNKVKFEIDQYRQRLGNIWSLKGINTEGILEGLAAVESLPQTVLGRAKLVSLLTRLSTRLSTSLHKYALEDLKEAGLVPIASALLP